MGGIAALAVVVLVAITLYRERSSVVATRERDIGLFASAVAHAATSALAADRGNDDGATGKGHVERLLAELARDPKVHLLALVRPDGAVDHRAGGAPAAEILTGVLQRARRSRAAAIETDLRSRLVHLAVPLESPSLSASAQPAYLYVQLDVTDSLASFGHYLWFGVAAAITLLVVVVVALYASLRRTVLRPVKQLARQAASLGSGELGARSGLDAHSAGSREMHQLAAAFDTMAAHMQASEEALEERARERTLDLEIAVAELESFSYAVSHDLRSPLRTIDGFALILAEKLGTAMSEEGRGYLERIRQQAQYMGSLIDNLLTLAHVSRTEVERCEADLGAIAADCVSALRRVDPHREADVTIDSPLSCEADVDMLRVALRHLFENAWKFTRDAPRARIEFGVQERYGRTAFFVRDNGVGFDPAYVERLFTPFRRLHSPRKFSGTGIGLAIVQRVIQRHGGQIWAESQPGQGATFWFTLGGVA